MKVSVRRFTAGEDGGSLIWVMIVSLLLVSLGVFVLTAVDRNNETRVSFQKSLAGFYAAEAGLNFGAAAVRNTFLDFNVPTDCTLGTFALNGRTVSHQLSGCGQTPSTVTLPVGDPFEGLNAIIYTYDLNAESKGPANFTEARLRLRFQSRLIPMFQFASFSRHDQELTVGPAMVINGRMHSNADLYLNTGNCDPGLRILGQMTISGKLYRGRKDSNLSQNLVRIALPAGTLQVLGTLPSSSSCSDTTRREPSTSEIASWGGRIRVGVKDVSLPGQDDLSCAPWSCPVGKSPGAYWERADLRIALDLSSPAVRLDGTPAGDPSGAGPALAAVRVYDAAGAVDATKTALLRTMMLNFPGIVTYSDAPAANWDCQVEGTNCESRYADYTNYGQAFPNDSTTRTANNCSSNANRAPRQAINGIPTATMGSNYCNDYRYGGFFNWRERKPYVLLNVDWTALEEWNQQQPSGSRLFDINDTTDGGLVIYLSVRGPNAASANNYGVRLYDAQRVRRDAAQAGVSFVSDQAFYVAGNLNCASPAVVDDTTPLGCGTNGKRPVAVIGDTVNVLSCHWAADPEAVGNGNEPWDAAGPCRSTVAVGADWRLSGTWTPFRPRDELSTGTSTPRGKRTVVNAAFLAGNDRTWCAGTPGGLDCGYDWYSGGLENYPRFHENWTGDSNATYHRLWYEGSLVMIDTPKHSCYAYLAGYVATNDPAYSCSAYTQQGFWRLQRYSPPLRRWFYDTGFNSAANLPPLSPRFVSLRQEFFTEDLR